MTSMRTALLAALLAAAPALADQPVVTGADLIARCAMRDEGNQVLCNLYLDDVLRQLDCPDRAYGLIFEGSGGMRWEGCPGTKTPFQIAHWHAHLPPLMVECWQKKPDYSARLGGLPWRQAMIATLTAEFPLCANASAS